MFENDYNLVGKHATYTKLLASDMGIFNRYIDVYMNAAILGFLYGRKSQRDMQSDDRARIYADAFANERMRCEFIYRLIMLLDETPEYISQNSIDRAFRYDSKVKEEEKNKKNMDLFHSYVFGGIEFLYEKFTENCATKDDYINKIFEVVTSFKEEIEGISYKDRIKEVMNDYKIR